MGSLAMAYLFSFVFILIFHEGCVMGSSLSIWRIIYHFLDCILGFICKYRYIDLLTWFILYAVSCGSYNCVSNFSNCICRCWLRLITSSRRMSFLILELHRWRQLIMLSKSVIQKTWSAYFVCCLLSCAFCFSWSFFDMLVSPSFISWCAKLVQVCTDVRPAADEELSSPYIEEFRYAF
jgi:hypothetical protein